MENNKLTHSELDWMIVYGGFPPIVGEVVVSKYSWDGDEIGEIRFRIELDEDLRDIYGLGDGLGVVSIAGKAAVGDRSTVAGSSP